jgi:two-component system, sensor histidine kinase and response regulator
LILFGKNRDYLSSCAFACIERAVMGEVILGYYDPALVCLSILIAAGASYAALELASCTFVYRGLARAIWIGGGAVAMGIGIWAMHYIGMLAFRLPVPVLYYLPGVGLSLLAAIASAAIALFFVSRSTLSIVRLGTGSLAMGTGIFGMHYIGMAAMRLPADCVYNPWIVALSGLIAVAVSGTALWITFNLRQEVGHFRWLRLASAIIMGVAICAMHYTGMAAASFRRAPMMGLSGYDVSISGIAVEAIVAVTLVILVLTVVAVVAARYVSSQTELLRNTQAEYRLFIEHNLASVCRTSLDGRVLEANWMALNVLGYHRRRDIIGVDIATHYQFPEDRDKMLKALERQGVLNGAEVLMKRTDGTPVWILFNVSLTKNLQTGNAEIITTAMDISAMKQTQDDLRSAKEAAEEANWAKGRFLANMSHELRTPLNGILGMTTLALDSDLPPDVRSYIEDANMSANQLLSIINDVLDYSKIEAQRLTFENDTFSLRQTFDDSIRTLAATAELKRIYLTCKLLTPLPELVLGDRGRLLQILLNLLGNAVKFTDRGGVVMSIETAPLGGQRIAVHVKVSDTGVGIPADKLDSIFDAFVQADNSDARRFGGSGLGLAISAQLAAGMNGKIWAESILGAGSTFHLLLNLSLPPDGESDSSAFSRIGDASRSLS